MIKLTQMILLLALSPSLFATAIDLFSNGRVSTSLVPDRHYVAPTGSEFQSIIRNMEGEEREEAILDQVLRGNIPSFLREMVPIKFSKRIAGKDYAATIYVASDYLSIGNDDDYFRAPLNLHSARIVADEFNVLLPTRTIVKLIHKSAIAKLKPTPLPPGSSMTSTEYFVSHNALIDTQLSEKGIEPGQLVAGHKKDVVISTKLNHNPQAIAIYGWHRPNGSIIQPLSVVHGAEYADYSHGIRMVSNIVEINGQEYSLKEVLKHPSMSYIFSDEGPVSIDPVTQVAENKGSGLILNN